MLYGLSENGLCPEEKQIDCLDYLVYQIGRLRYDKQMIDTDGCGAAEEF